ncbi:glycosyltransferase [Alteromonas sp. IB21]|uniref:glycosyltransferase n=1 Tax=Alteromonas sp. IB21 TaxID=2779369 RepID=UPI0018E8C15B|nr:glycosyltransferase [Alteromonas sp. IB21]MBJ2130634.1 glycosyltransferase [Alteromonas sp. IB21]
MKILHIGKYFAPFKGGIENMMLALIKAQTKAGLDISVLVHHHKEGLPYGETKEFGANIYKLPIVAKLLFVPVALSAFWHLKKILKQTQPDVIHAHLPNVTCFWLLLLPTTLKSKLILHWHSDVIGERPNLGIKLLYPFYRVFEKALLRKANRIIVTSENYLQSSKPLKLFLNKCEVVPLGLEDSHDDVKRTAGFDVGALCVGRLTYYKGHEFLIRAFSEIKHEKIPLTIVGEGEERKRLELIVSELGLQNRVRFLGQIDDLTLNALIANCSFLILSSIERTEAFGLVLLEAMRAGKACICTDVRGSGMSNVVQHKRTGLIACHSNIESIAGTIDTLAFDPSLRERYGKSGRLRFLSKFQVKSVERQIWEIYNV